jgi:hypothetical protein
MSEWSQEEILRVSDQLARSELYGASQMVCGLARERDEAESAILALRAELEKARGERDENKWCKSKLIEMRAERDSARAEERERAAQWVDRWGAVIHCAGAIAAGIREGK